MPFSDSVREKVLKMALYHCCVCQKAGLSIEVHHIVPQAHGGDDSDDNAAPLCPTCHADYGDNPVKRKAIMKRRDFWYKLCRKREEPRMQWVKMADTLEKIATKEDLSNLGNAITSEIISIITQPAKPVAQIALELSTFTGTLGSVTSGLSPSGWTALPPEGLGDMQIVGTSASAAPDYSYGIRTIDVSSPMPIFNVSAVTWHPQVHVWPLRALAQVGAGRKEQLALKVEWAKAEGRPQEAQDSYHRRFLLQRPRDPGPPWEPLYITFEAQSGGVWAAVAYMRVERQQHGHPESHLLYGPNPYGWVRGQKTQL